jgi:ATP-dependent RNA helicase SUPV3L1/SUV3
VAIEITAETLSGETSASPAIAAAVEEPKPILIWRLNRIDGNRRHGRDQQRGGPRRRQQGAPAAAAGSPGETQDGQRKGGQRRGNRRPEKKDEAPKEPKVLWRASDPRPERPPRPEGEQQQRRENRGPRRDDRKPRNEDRAPRNFEAGPKRDVNKADPDSPFAKLAALRDQLRK